MRLNLQLPLEKSDFSGCHQIISDLYLYEAGGFGNGRVLYIRQRSFRPRLQLHLDKSKRRSGINARSRFQSSLHFLTIHDHYRVAPSSLLFDDGGTIVTFTYPDYSKCHHHQSLGGTKTADMITSS